MLFVKHKVPRCEKQAAKESRMALHYDKLAERARLMLTRARCFRYSEEATLGEPGRHRG